MEKFSKWADKSGVNPFIPAIPSLPTNKVVKFLRVIFGFCLLLIRVPLIIIITAVYCILRLLTHPYFISILGASITQKEGEGNMGFGLFVFGLGLLMKKHKMFFRIILRLIDMSVLKILLLGLALNFREEPADAKRLGLKSMHKKEKFPDPIGKGLDRGDLIISNYVSFAQIIYLQSQFSPLYTAVVLPEEEGSVETSVIELGFFGALYHSVRGPIRSSSVKKTETLSAILDRNRYTAPVVVFPEAVRTNGDALLKFADIFDLGKFPMTASVFLFMFSFKGNGYSACHPVGPIWSKLFWLIFQLRNEASIYYINGYDTPPMPIPQICQNAEKEKANKRIHHQRQTTSFDKT